MTRRTRPNLEFVALEVRDIRANFEVVEGIEEPNLSYTAFAQIFSVTVSEGGDQLGLAGMLHVYITHVNPGAADDVAPEDVTDLASISIGFITACVLQPRLKPAAIADASTDPWYVDQVIRAAHPTLQQHVSQMTMWMGFPPLGLPLAEINIQVGEQDGDE